MRARNIKPALFKNELLGAADPLLTILFEGLWCEADREGRLEDRPLRLGAQIFPYRRDVNVEEMLNWLTQNGFIERYEVLSTKVIQVVKFSEHQRPHSNEVQSVLPAKVGSKHRQGSKYVLPRGKPLRSDPLLSDPLLSDPPSLIPDTRSLESEKLRAARSAGHRLPEGWVPDEAMCQYATDLKLDPAKVLIDFRGYWLAKAGPNARKVDWNLTWQTWCRRESDRRSGADQPVRKTRFAQLTEHLNVEGPDPLA